MNDNEDYLDDGELDYYPSGQSYKPQGVPGPQGPQGPPGPQGPEGRRGKDGMYTNMSVSLHLCCNAAKLWL